jgi:hypothetical protein
VIGAAGLSSWFVKVSPTRAVVLLLVAMTAMVLLALLMLALNRAGLRRLRTERADRLKRRELASRAASPRSTDPWAEAGRRVPLETDPDVPREPPEDQPPNRGFHARR